MPQSRTADRILDEEFLTLRAKALELAAGLDRLDLAAGDIEDDPRRRLLTKAIDLLQEEKGNRAERIQFLFSRDYAPDWPAKLGVTLLRKS